MDEPKQPRLLTLVLKLACTFHRLLFGAELGSEARNFVTNLFYVTLGSGIASVITFAFTILGGRFLGPIEFGKFSLIQSTAFILYIPMLAGFGSALVKFASETGDIQVQRITISTTYWLTILSSTVSITIYFAIQNWLAGVLSLSHELLMMTIFVSTAYVVYTLAISTQRGLKLMKSYAMWQPVYAMVLISTFFLFVYFRTFTFQAMAVPLLLAYGVTGFAIIFILGKEHYFEFRFDRILAGRLNKYAFWGLVAITSSSIYANIGKIIIAHYMNFSDVGIYSAYFGSSLSLGNIIFLTFNSVFFPTISGYQDKNTVLVKLDHIIPYLALMVIVGVFAFELLIIRLFGNNYPLDYGLMLSFSIATALSLWYNVYAVVFNAEGLNGARLASFSVILIAGLVGGLSLLLIPRFGLEGAVWATSIGFVCGTVCLALSRKMVFPKPSNPPISPV